MMHLLLSQARWRTTGSQRQYQVRFEADGHHVIAFVSDEVQAALVPLNERSRGFQWFFSFDTTFLHETQGTFKNAVILLDEPGLHLHAAAQRDLLARLKEYARDNQLIYTTHMPFMIDLERLDNLRVCTESKGKGSTVSADFYAADEHARFPLQAALGLSISQSLFIGSYNLVVEGVTDFWSAFDDGDDSPIRKQNIVERASCNYSVGRRDKGSLCSNDCSKGNNSTLVVLLDSDPEGKKAAGALIKQWIVKDKHGLLLGQAVQKRRGYYIRGPLPR